MVEERCEFHPPVLLGGFLYALKSHRRISPALSPACGRLLRVPLGCTPSLHRLRRFPLVRRLLRYYGRIRLLNSVDGGITATGLFHPVRQLPATTMAASTQ